ncbi:protein FAM151B isoform X3 [Centrocercus urophasianus]|uniref:protein FAM151B isoform X3 n=1 Tax=Centrocercus urophasianus TaxID=9002 RepID=UPI001C64901C|nr:protein FAM151B isoform X3 [Centrocercus urophasianus]
MAAEQSVVSAAGPAPVALLRAGGRGSAALRAVPLGAAGARSQAAVEHFLRAGRLAARDGAQIRWWHAANSQRWAREAARSTVHMVEGDVLLRGGRGGDGDPIMAHPPETDSDITLQEWLEEMVSTDKGIKLDFKSLDAVLPSLELLQLVKPCLERPVWLNADILPGPNGISPVVDAKGFLDTVTSFFPDVTLSLGWTTGWHPEQHNEGSLLPESHQEKFANWSSGTFPEEKLQLDNGERHGSDMQCTLSACHIPCAGSVSTAVSV